MTVGVPYVHRCLPCKGGDEQYCEPGCNFTYNGDEKNSNGLKTKGGYADHVVVDQECAIPLETDLHFLTVLFWESLRLAEASRSDRHMCW